MQAPCLGPAASWLVTNLGVNPLHTCLQPAGEITRMLLPFMAWIRNIQEHREKGRHPYNRNKSNKMMSKSINTMINQSLSKWDHLPAIIIAVPIHNPDTSARV